MENSRLGGRIIMEMENLIALSCPQEKVAPQFQKLHVALIKKHYNAADVAIDYHRKRVIMDVVFSDQDYDPKTVNLHLPTFRMNLWYRNLCTFLKTCLNLDARSLAFYAHLLHSFEKKEMPLTIA